MKRVFTVIIATCALTMGVNQNVNAQVEQGNILIDPYVGAPTGNIWWGALANETGFKTKGLPISYGARVEYMVADNFGLGVDVNYVVSGYTYTTTYDTYNSTTGLYESTTEETSYTAKKLRAMLRLNYHIVQTDNFDAYLGVGAGYKNVNRVATIDGSVDGDATMEALIPIAFRFAFGGRYYFTDNIGINFELGAGGGGVIQGGLALKF